MVFVMVACFLSKWKILCGRPLVAKKVFHVVCLYVRLSVIFFVNVSVRAEGQLANIWDTHSGLTFFAKIPTFVLHTREEDLSHQQPLLP